MAVLLSFVLLVCLLLLPSLSSGGDVTVTTTEDTRPLQSTSVSLQREHSVVWEAMSANRMAEWWVMCFFLASFYCGFYTTAVVCFKSTKWIPWLICYLWWRCDVVSFWLKIINLIKMNIYLHIYDGVGISPGSCVCYTRMSPLSTSILPMYKPVWSCRWRSTSSRARRRRSRSRRFHWRRCCRSMPRSGEGSSHVAWATHIISEEGGGRGRGER